MDVVVGKLAGFCSGVNFAVQKATEIVEEKNEVYCLGELVHNKQVIKALEEKGMITVETLEEIPNGKTVIFRAHGEAECIYDKAKEKDLEIIDLTCGNVRAIHKKVEKEKKDSFIIILGKRKHPETIGNKGFAGENSFVIENSDDILDAYMEYEKTLLGKVYVVAQTTFSSKYFDELTEEIKTNFIEADVKVEKTICNATELRQKETLEMSKNFHNMIIIGGKNSSNTKELVKVAELNCQKVYAIETVEELKNIDFSNVEKVGIMAGASTPKESIDDVKKYLENI